MQGGKLVESKADAQAAVPNEVEAVSNKSDSAMNDASPKTE
jgi:hypothetical protein